MSGDDVLITIPANTTMTRRLLRRYLPNRETVKQHRHLQVFGERLHDPNLWHLNRRSVAGALGIGLFMAFMPFPSQMLLAAGAAIVLRVNLPLAVASVWVTNPITIPPIFYFSYRVGTWVLDVHPEVHSFELSWHWLAKRLDDIWAPLLVGCLILGTIAGLTAYATVRVTWRVAVLRRRRRSLRPPR